MSVDPLATIRDEIEKVKEERDEFKEGLKKVEEELKETEDEAQRLRLEGDKTFLRGQLTALQQQLAAMENQKAALQQQLALVMALEVERMKIAASGARYTSGAGGQGPAVAGGPGSTGIQGVQAGAPSTSGAGGSGPPPGPLARTSEVVALLSTKYARPKREVLRIMETHFWGQMGVLSTPTGAIHLYERCRNLPQSSTRARLREAVGIAITGPLSPLGSADSDILAATATSGRPAVVKLLRQPPAAEGSWQQEWLQVEGADRRLPLEAALCDAFELAPWDALEHPHFLARSSAVHLERTELREELSTHALIMSRCSVALTDVAQLDGAALAAGAHRLRSALAFIHSKGFAHCDCKAANVLMQPDGGWLLCDFGSATLLGQPVSSYTSAFHPLSLRGKPACVGFDWDMLLVLLLMELHKDSAANGDFQSAEGRADLGTLRQHLGEALMSGVKRGAESSDGGRGAQEELLADALRQLSVMGTLEWR